jgi:hypothetical protein
VRSIIYIYIMNEVDNCLDQIIFKIVFRTVFLIFFITRFKVYSLCSIKIFINILI